MKMLRSMRRAVGCALLLACALVHAQTDAPTAELLMKRSGLWEQLGSIGTQAGAGFADALKRGGARPSAAESERLQRAISAAYAADRLRAICRDVIARGLDTRHVAPLQAWLETPAAQTISRLEAQASASSSDPQQVLAEGVAELGRAAPARRQLLEALLAETRAAEAMVQITIATALATHRGVASVMPGQPGPSAREIEAAAQAQRPQMLKAFSAMMLASFARVYAELPDAQLGEYVAFMKTDAGRAYNDVALQALEAAMTDAGHELGRALPAAKDKANT